MRAWKARNRVLLWWIRTGLIIYFSFYTKPVSGSPYGLYQPCSLRFYLFPEPSYMDINGPRLYKRLIPPYKVKKLVPVVHPFLMGEEELQKFKFKGTQRNMLTADPDF